MRVGEAAYAMGGNLGGSEAACRTVERFEPRMNRWSRVEGLLPFPFAGGLAGVL